MSGTVAEERNKDQTKIKDIGMFLFLVSPLLIFCMGYEIGPYFIYLMLLLGLVFGMVWLFIPILEPKDENNEKDEEKEEITYFFIGFGF